MNANLHRLLLTPKERASVFLCENDLLIPGDNETFDAVIVERPNEIKCSNILVNVFLKEVHKCLKPSGEIVIALANKLSYRRWLRRNIDERACFSLNNMRAELIKAGFRNIKIFTVYHNLDNMVSMSPIGRVVAMAVSEDWKRKIKASILNNRLFRHFHPAYILQASKNGVSAHGLFEKIAKHCGVSLVDRIIIGKPRTAIIIASDRVIRMPLDKLSAIRCRQGKRTLARLAGMGQAGYAPRFLGSGAIYGQEYSVESRIAGECISPKDKRINILTRKAAELICEFHRNTAKDVLVNEIAYRRLFKREFSRLASRVNQEYKEKLAYIESRLAQNVLGVEFRTVWMHGDYKIENVLMDGVTAKINGIIDWDLSKNMGLPLLDIFYLLFYNESVLTGKSVLQIFLNRFSLDDFTGYEKDIIDNYLVKIKLSAGNVAPMLIMFFLHHTTQRYGQMFADSPSFKDKWLRDEVYAGIDHIMGNYAQSLKESKWD